VYLDAFIVFKILTMITPVDQVMRIFKWPNFFQTQCIYNVSHTFLGPTKPCFYTLDANFSSFSTLAGNRINICNIAARSHASSL